ncbi:MAG: GlxA family transcriptional regulator [Pseudomonadota bacterium]
MSYASVVEPLRAANLMADAPLYQVTHFGAARSSAATRPPVERAVGEAAPLDMLFVIAGGDPVAFQDQKTLAWLGRLARAGVTLAGVSGGPVILARAGLMAGRRMTVHWEHADALAELEPSLMLERSLYVVDRDRITCAGGTAPLDLMHTLIAQDHGAAFARRVSDWFMHTDVRPEGGPQRAGLVARVGTTSQPVLDAVAAMESHIADPLSLPQLALIAGVSPRHLSRAFQDRLGTSAIAYYRRLRLEVADGLLRNAPLPITQIALATGYASSAHFSREYARAFGQAPKTRRR